MHLYQPECSRLIDVKLRKPSPVCGTCNDREVGNQNVGTFGVALGMGGSGKWGNEFGSLCVNNFW